MTKKQVRDIERKYAQRVTRLAVARATRKGNVMLHTQELWAIVAADTWTDAYRNRNK